ncbi:MAG: ATP-binding protein, partial [Candidatus Thorarchaeota archaeon]|nr:ATP-binding protein [Candidatus Thorarchaeota archaeon]
YFKMVSFIFIYGALIHASLNKPYETLFIDLKQHEQRLTERTIELEATNKELEAFSYSVSHDLKSPLGTMDGFSKLLLSKHAEGLDDKAKHYLERIRVGTQHMARIIDDLLKLSRLSRTVIHRQTVDLTAISRKIAVELQQSEPDRKAKFVIEEELVLYCDPGQLRIAMTNLLHNAWKFTLHFPETLIEVGRTNRNGHTVFFIRDNGVGFDMDYAAKMFTPFQRFHSEIEFEGFGIGLATVNRIVNRHGGAIWAEAAVGKGATFFFRLDGGVTNNDHE